MADYEREAIQVFTKYREVMRRRQSEAKEQQKRLPEFFTLNNQIRCKPATLIQGLAEMINADPDDLKSGERIQIEKALEPILIRYNVRPEWIPFVSKVMSEQRIAAWGKEKSNGETKEPQ